MVSLLGDRSSQSIGQQPPKPEPSTPCIMEHGSIGDQSSISTQQGQRLTDRLRHQQAIKGIAVMEWELFQGEDVLRCQGEQLKTGCVSPAARLTAETGISVRARACLIAISQSEM
jgi:hypothetical protein